ncbi:FxSxx-COOH system tetratricopeptide repeat protein [Pseudofrankia inefficax]|uniref:Effector-associated domain-containing protein n=1 Tax=Pseudofrankia inefficax (strain DSM 45817 / CECT 9037 / DDB 130130 / EuI1c) TaxID=298654 RepID=E3J3M8_PSEI1|nr:FxSxx-COOH system tetratricopeptide repeat protein [Pseudofrankia inefficax]ADP79365.1 hypothetical protein FraEuI1c_1295 [Pseudofrankia inefficax]
MPDALSELEIRELAAAFHAPGAARQLLETAGVPRERQPGWGECSAEEFWREVATLLRSGVLADGRERVLTAARRRFPANHVFAIKKPQNGATPADDRADVGSPIPVRADDGDHARRGTRHLLARRWISRGSGFRLAAALVVAALGIGVACALLVFLPPRVGGLGAAVALIAAGGIAAGAWLIGTGASPVGPVAARADTSTSVGASLGRGIVVDRGSRLNVRNSTITFHAEASGEVVPPKVHVRMGHLPLRPAAYEDRPELSGMLDYRLGQGRSVAVCVLVGARGVGKSSLAAAHARRAAEHGWSVVAWFDARDSAGLLVAFSLLAEQLGVALDKEPEASAHAALDWLRATRQRCLLVFDNAVDPDAVRRWIPATGNVRVIITTNETDFAVLSTAAPIEVEVFTSVQAVAYLDRRTGGGVEGAAELAEDLGRLPLALAQAAPTIIDDVHEGRSYAGYRARMASVPLRELLGPVRGDAYPLGYAQAVMLAVERVEQEMAAVGPVRRVLDIVALLAGDAIPLDLVRATGVEGDAEAVDQVLRRLESISLLNRVGTGAVGMHHLTQLVLLGRGRRLSTLGGSLRDLVAALEATAPATEDAWPRRALIGQRARQLTHLLGHSEAGLASAPDLHERLLRVQAHGLELLNEVSDHALVLAHGTEVVARLADVAGTDDPAVLSARQHLGEAYRRSWREPEAAALLEQVLDARVRVSGPDHPDTVATRAALAGAYLLTGQLARAEDLFSEVVRARHAALGTRHRQALAARNDLATVKAARGDLASAIEILDEVYRDRVAALGKDDSDTIDTRLSLMSVSLRAGEIDRATVLAEQVVADRRRVRGVDHPETLAARRNLAFVYVSDGRVNEAMLLMEEVLRGYQRVHGDDHHETLFARIYLADVYEAAGRDGEAVARNERTLPLARAAFGEDHFLVQACASRLAAAYLKRGSYQEAIALHTNIAAEQRGARGDDDSKVVNSRTVLARSLRSVGRIGEAVDLFRSIVADLAATVGPDHPDALSVRGELADALLEARAEEAAVGLYEDVVRARRRVQGDDHPDTLRDRAGLADAYRQTWRRNEAVAAFEEVVADWARLRGPEHPSTIGARKSLADAYAAIGRRDDAANELEQVFEARTRLLGDDHPRTLTTMGALAQALAHTGRHDRVIPLLTAAAAGFARVSGRAHIDTLTARRALADAYLALGETQRGLALHVQAAEDARQDFSRTTLVDVGLDLSLSLARLKAGQLTGTTESLERGVDTAERELGADHHSTLLLRDAVAAQYLDLDDITAAIRVHEESLARRRARFGDTHRSVLDNRFRLAKAYLRAGRNKEAVAAFADLAKVVTSSRPNRDRRDAAMLLASVRRGLAEAHLHNGDYDQAVRLAAESVAEARRAVGADNEIVFEGRALHADALAAAGRTDEAIAAYEGLITDLGRTLNGSRAEALGYQVRLAWLQHSAAHFERSAALLTEVIAVSAEIWGERHPQTLRARSLYAQATGAQAAGADPRDERGVAEAVDRLRDVNATQREALGPDHPDGLDSRYALQTLLRLAGRQFEALAVLEDLAGDQRRVRGEGHRSTLQTRGDQAEAHFDAGHHDQAIALQERLVADERDLLTAGDELLVLHRASLTRMYVLAGRHSEARTLAASVDADLDGDRNQSMWRVIQQQMASIALHKRLSTDDPTDDDLSALIAVHGSDDPTVLRFRYRLAIAHGTAGDPARAATEFTEIVGDFTKVFGADHEDTLFTRSYQAYWRAEAGDPAGSIVALERLMTDVRRVLGDEHTLQLSSRILLAKLRGRTGGDPAATAAEFAVLVPLARVRWGPDHPDTLATAEGLARWRGEAGDPAGAIAVAADLLSRRMVTLGPDHPATLSVRVMLARWQGEAGDPVGALLAIESVLVELVRVLGPAHRLTATARVIRARWLRETGDAAGAATELLALIPLHTDLFGPDHEEVWTIQHNAALWHLEVDDAERAILIGTELLASKERALGPSHRSTLESLGELAAWHGHAGRPRQAAAELAELLPVVIDALGPEDEITYAVRGAYARWCGEAGDTAIAMLTELLPEIQRALGPDHYRTRAVAERLEEFQGRADQPADA